MISQLLVKPLIKKKKKYFTKSNVYNELVSNQIQIHFSEYARSKQMILIEPRSLKSKGFFNKW